MSYEKVCMYLRKSRADLEAEARGEGETLAKHRKMLLSVAKKLKLNIVKIREEIVSGESLMARPQMLELLREVENGEYDAVLVMDMDRLGRGNMQEQGLILDTFKASKTKIITPRKIYNLEDEWDEEYSEFEAFMARKELKIITRRLQRGRARSVEDGNYIGNVPPYGYVRVKVDGSYTLQPHPEQADVVRMIFDMYVNQNQGCQSICRRLNALGIPSAKNGLWSLPSVRDILQNPVYIGKVRWKSRPQVKNKDGTKSRPRADKETMIIANGKHEAIVDPVIFNKAQEIFKSKNHVPAPAGKISNPLAGLIRCDICGSSMVLRPYRSQPAHIICHNMLCSNKSAQFTYVENRVLKGLKDWLKEYKANWEVHNDTEIQNTDTISIKEKQLKALYHEAEQLELQKGRLHDLLERGIYDVDTYLERSQNLAKRIEDTNQRIAIVEQEINTELRRLNAQKEIIPKVENVLDLYTRTDDPAKKNELLKSVLEKAVYRKEKHQRLDNFTLVLYPKLPG
jgi:site-specific DNA recombinase